MKAKRVLKKSKFQSFLLFIVFFAFFSLIFTYVFFTYKNIDVSESNYEVKRVSSTNNADTVENIINNSNKISDILENAMSSVVGISKLKDNGSSIFSSNNFNSIIL